MLKDDNREQIPLFEMVQVKENKKPGRKTMPEQNGKKKLTGAQKVGEIKARKKTPVNDLATAKKKKIATSTGIGSEKSPSGQVPEGDVRLTANIREDLHLKLKIMAARRRTTIGELLEELVDKYI